MCFIATPDIDSSDDADSGKLLRCPNVSRWLYEVLRMFRYLWNIKSPEPTKFTDKLIP